METEYETRLREFGQAYEDFEADDVRKLIKRAGDRLAALCLNEDAVDTAMKSLHSALGLPDVATDHVGNRSWRTLWEETPTVNLLDLPLAQRLTSLNAYAYFGLSPAHNEQACTIGDIKSVIETVNAAVDSDNVDRSLTVEIDKTLLAAQARLALDEGTGVAPHQLAALTRIGIKSIRNALAPSSGSGLELKDGTVTAASALKWLNARGDFKTSIWHEVLAGATTAKQDDAIKGKILWVPFASDNTEFHPVKCQRNNKYQIGPKGSEKSVTDYFQALDCLARMRPVAYWRRPNTVGNWGIVTAVGFRPRTAEELDLLSDQAGDK
jgi:hypothetical protein